MTPEQIDAILADITGGMGTIKAVEAHGLHRMTFYRALDADKTLCDRYARAKDASLEAMADETLEIADTVAGDTFEGDDGIVRIAPDVVARARLRVDTRKWLLSKLAPKKYGDKVDVQHGGTVDLSLTVKGIG